MLESSQRDWSAGDECRAKYSEDGIWYEGTIVSVQRLPNSDKDYALVNFVGYGNEETFWLDELMPSLGIESRNKQILASGGGIVIDGAASSEYAIGDNCRAVFSEDGVEYEAKIVEIMSENDKKSCHVRFVGYGNSDTVLMQDLKPSRGSDARKKQRMEAKGETTLNPSHVDDTINVTLHSAPEHQNVTLNQTTTTPPITPTKQPEINGASSLCEGESISKEVTFKTSILSDPTKPLSKLDVNANESLTDESTETITAVNTEINMKLHFIEELETAKRESETLIDENTKLTKQLETLRSQCLDLVNSKENNTEVNDLRKKVQEWTDAHAKINSLYQAEKSLTQSVTMEIEDMKRKEAEMRHRLNEELSRVKQLMAENEKLKSDNSINLDSSKIIVKLKSDNETLQSKVKELKQVNKSLSIGNLDLVDQVGKLKSNFAENMDVERLKEKLKAAEAKCEEMKITNSKLIARNNTNGNSKGIDGKLDDSVGNPSEVDVLRREIHELAVQLERVKESLDITMSSNESKMSSKSFISEPVNLGGVWLQPVITYLPTSNVVSETLSQHGDLNVKRGGVGGFSPKQFSTSSLEGIATTPDDERSKLRRPFATTEAFCLSPKFEGRLPIVCKGSVGSERIVKELRDRNTPTHRIYEIYEDLGPSLSSIIIDDCGHKVILALLDVGGNKINASIFSHIWKNLNILYLCSAGVSVILRSIAVKSWTCVDHDIVGKAIVEHFNGLIVSTHGYKIINTIIEKFKPTYLINVVISHLEICLACEGGKNVIVKFLSNYGHSSIFETLKILIQQSSELETNTLGLSVIETIVDCHIADNIVDDGCITQLLEKTSTLSWPVMVKKLEQNSKGLALLRRFNVI